MLVEHALQWVWRALGGTRVEVFYTLLVFLGVLLMVRCVQWLQYIRTLPPGPWGLPMFGYLPFIKGDVHLKYSKLAEKYGSMFSVRLGSKLIVVLSDYRVIRDTFRREEFTGRPHTEFNSILDGYGIINTEGALWKSQRKFLHEKLRSFGMTFNGSGKKVMQSRIMREVTMFLRGLELRRGAPTNISSFLYTSISNVICSIIMGMRFQHGDPQFQRFMNLIDEGFKLFGRVAAVDYIPMMRHLPFVQDVTHKISQNREEMGDFFQKTVNQHRASFDENEIHDLVDTYLLEMQQAKEEGRDGVLFQGKDHDRQLQQILGDLFSAGMETVKTTMEWAVLMMLHHPEAAQAVQKELDEVVGRSRMPTLEDFASLPITEATILEVLRRSSVVPLGTTHATTRDVTVNGYTIPAGSSVVPLLHAVHMDPKLWHEPEAFRPCRFLTDEGKVHKPEYFMPFGVGRRMCLGDMLARMELFMFFSSLMHCFDLEVPEGASLPSLRGNAGATVSPDPFKVCLLQRDLSLMVDCNSNEVMSSSTSSSSSGPLRNVGSH